MISSRRASCKLSISRSGPQFLAGALPRRSGEIGRHDWCSARSINKITTADLTGFATSTIGPTTRWAIVGDVTMKDILPKLEKAFGSWAKGDVPATTIPATGTPGTALIQLINRPGSVQTVLQLGALGIERTNPDYFAVAVMNEILGGGPQARLFMNLREDKGYTYGAYSNFGVPVSWDGRR